MRLEKDIKTIFIDNEKPIFWCKQCHGTDVIYNLSFSQKDYSIQSQSDTVFGQKGFCLDCATDRKYLESKDEVELELIKGEL